MVLLPTEEDFSAAQTDTKPPVAQQHGGQSPAQGGLLLVGALGELLVEAKRVT